MRFRFRPAVLGRSDLDLPLLQPPRLAPPDLDPPSLEPPTAWRGDAESVTDPVAMWQVQPRGWPDTGGSVEDERLRPLYARALGLRHVEPGGLLCFLFFEGTVVLGFLLALAELVSWWGVLMLPASVALMVKINDVVAAAVARSAARVPEREQERFRRELQPAIGRAAVPASSAGSGTTATPGRRAVRSAMSRGHGTPAVALVRPELAPMRARPRPLPALPAPDDPAGHGELAGLATTAPDITAPDITAGRDGDATPGTTASGRAGVRESPPARRSRNAHPLERGRRTPTYLPDRREPTGSTEQWMRQSARERYGFD